MSFKETSPEELNKRITLQLSTRVVDGMGGFTVTWSDHATVWAAIWPTSAKEMVAANAVTMQITHRIRIRYRSSVRASWRVKFGNRYFAIVSILNPSEKNEWLDIMCREAA